MANASLVVTVSDYSVARLVSDFPKSKRKVRRVYNGLDVERFGKAVAGPKLEPPLILSVGRLIEKKGFDDLIRAAAILKERDVAFHVKVVGDGPLEAELKALIEALGVGDRVELSGPKSQEEITELLGAASLFALPCVTESDGGMDNLPTVIMEAMAASVPCVSTRLAGVPEMIVDGVTGRLVAERDTEALADALAELLESPGRAREMGERGLERARSDFSKSVTAGQLARHLIRRGRIPRDENLIESGLVERRDYLAQKVLFAGRNPKPKKRPLDYFGL